MFAVFPIQIVIPLISSGDANVKYVAENKCILDQNTDTYCSACYYFAQLHVNRLSQWYCGKQKLPFYLAHKTSFSVFEFRARLTSLLSRSMIVNSVLTMQIENVLTTITWKTLTTWRQLLYTCLRGRSFKKCSGKSFQRSRSRSRTTAQKQCRECHNGTSWILKRAAKWSWNRSNGKRCENQT